MIELRGLSKSFRTRSGRKIVAQDISAIFPPRRAVAILGRNGAGKSTLLRMISGALDPDAGRVLRRGSVSWPVGFAGSFHPDLTGVQNVRFIARVYGIDTDELVDFVADFAELGAHFHQPVREYSSGMRSRLAFGASMGIRFDTYLVDEVTAVGDAAFQQKCLGRMETVAKQGRTVLFVSHNMGAIRSLCTKGIVLDQGTVATMARKTIPASISVAVWKLVTVRSRPPTKNPTPFRAFFEPVRIETQR